MRKALRRLASAARVRSRIRMVVFDFDGVFTDNRVLVLQDGREAVFCSRADGLGLGRLAEAGWDILVLSSEKNPVVRARCRKLGLPCIQGYRDKLKVLRRETRRRSLSLSQVCYVGNDANDRPCMEAAGLSVCVADAEPEARRAAKIVLKRPGGHGAVRELCDWFLSARGPGAKH